MSGPTLILLSTHNGAAFLPDQLASLRAQQRRDWHLLVRDDGSGDATADLLHAAAARDGRVEWLPADGRRLGARSSFGELMRLAGDREAQRVAFCDQDDVWRPDKLARQCAALDDLERIHGSDTPLLVHSDLAVVDATLRRRHRSMMALQRIRRPADAPPLTLLAQNHIPGCATLCNRAALALAVPVPAAAWMHDWWLALCVEFAGVRRYLPDALVQYRQHGGNVTGAQGLARRLLRPAGWTRWLVKMAGINQAGWVQAALLLERLTARDGGDADGRRAGLAAFVAAAALPGRRRSRAFARLGVRCQNAPMTALYYAHALLLPPAGR